MLQGTMPFGHRQLNINVESSLSLEKCDHIQFYLRKATSLCVLLFSFLIVCSPFASSVSKLISFLVLIFFMSGGMGSIFLSVLLLCIGDMRKKSVSSRGLPGSENENFQLRQDSFRNLFIYIVYINTFIHCICIKKCFVLLEKVVLAGKI